MWNNSGNWNMWAMQPAAYSNIPSDQVDWASLAKQWIANREMLGVPQPVTVAAPPPPLLPPVKPVPPMGRLGDMPAMVGGSVMAQTQPQAIVCDMENSNSQDSNYFQAGGESEQGTSEGWNNWNQNMPAWAVPPPPPPVEESQNFTRGNANTAGPEMPYGGNSGQYMTPAFSFNQSNEEMYSGPYEHAGFQQFWGQGPMAPHQVVPDKNFGPVHDTMEYRAPPKRGSRIWPPINDVPPLLDESGIDAAKRRQLPLWIREGLEKMEREKQRQMEKEQLELAMQNAKKAREEAENDNMEGKVEITGPIKSIFDSDDEEKPSDAYDVHQSSPHSEPQKLMITEQKKSRPSEDEEEEEDVPESDEERQARMMLKVRQMLTEVLLEVTNREIEDVAHSFYSHAKRKQALAPARQLAKSTALASITSLGLGYGSESSEGEAEDQASSDNAEDSDDEAALQERIRRKKAEFEQKMREAEEMEKTKEMEILKHADEPPKSQKHSKTSVDPSYTSKVENEDDGSRTGQETETARTRSKADHGSKTECLEEKKQFGEEVSRTKVAASKQTSKSRKVEVEESSESDSDSNSDNSSSSDSSEASSSETSESEKGAKNVPKKQPKSQTSVPNEGPRVKERDQNRRRNEEEMRAAWQESSGRSRKEADRKKPEAKEEERRPSKKKRARNSSNGEGEGLGEEQSEKRRHVYQSDDKHSRHRLEEPRTASRQTERTEDKDRSRRHKDSGQNHKKFSQKQDDRAKSDDSDRHDTYDYLSRTCEQDYERSAKSRHKRSKHSQSSHSSTERPSRHRHDRTPDRRRSTHGQRSSSGKDRGHHKSANNRSGKKERAKRRSRSRSR